MVLLCCHVKMCTPAFRDMFWELNTTTQKLLHIVSLFRIDRVATANCWSSSQRMHDRANVRHQDENIKRMPSADMVIWTCRIEDPQTCIHCVRRVSNEASPRLQNRPNQYTATHWGSTKDYACEGVSDMFATHKQLWLSCQRRARTQGRSLSSKNKLKGFWGVAFPGSLVVAKWLEHELKIAECIRKNVYN